MQITLLPSLSATIRLSRYLTIKPVQHHHFAATYFVTVNLTENSETLSLYVTANKACFRNQTKVCCYFKKLALIFTGIFYNIILVYNLLYPGGSCLLSISMVANVSIFIQATTVQIISTQ